MPPEPKTTVMSVRVTQETSEKLSELAEQMGITKQELVGIVIRNGSQELEAIIKGASNPVVNLALKLAVQIAGTPEEVEEITQKLDLIKQSRKNKKRSGKVSPA